MTALPSRPPSPQETHDRRSRLADDLRGAGQLAVDAVTGVAGIAEGLHRTIGGRGTGLSGLVYRGVRGVARGVGSGLGAALAALAPRLGDAPAGPQREAVLAALNGVLGDHLEASGNPLAIGMRLRRQGAPVALERAALLAGMPDARGTLLLMVHGLCMNDLQWRRAGHDHRAHLAQALDASALYLHYNTGRHISRNGAELAHLLEQLLQAWPRALERLVIVGHSMGGLVARSAVQQARLGGLKWPGHLSDLVFLGTPHHGAALERAGNWAEFVAGFSPHALPFTGLARVRSAGIRDLRHGSLLDADWQARAQNDPRDARAAVPLPEGVRCHAVAATKSPAADEARPRGDGLVSVASALGRHADPAFDLGIPAQRRRVVPSLDHFDLLASREVAAQLVRWLT